MDCGKKKDTGNTKQGVREQHAASFKTDRNLGEGCEIIEPCYLGENVSLHNSTIGPHVSIGEGPEISYCQISHSIIMKECKISNSRFTNSMIGNHAVWDGEAQELSISDYSTNIKT